VESLGGSTQPDEPGIGREYVFPREATDVLFRRFLAHMVDGLLLTALLFVLLVVAAVISGPVIAAVLLLWITAGPTAYFVYTQRRTGQSPGKRLTRIRVVNRLGETPDTHALIIRSLTLLLEFTYVIALISTAFSAENQRLGDRWAGTYVIAA
jgi:uncharacterized RDD family membrane protein YckC